jgi:glycerophosphoryl diester phosphodiesterase
LVEVYGHRGVRFPGAPPENTPTAVRQALLAGAAGVEVDVRLDPAGRLVCSHDLVSASDEPALFADVATAARGARLIVEVKNVPHEPDFQPPEALVSLDLVLEQLDDPTQVVVSSFDFAVSAAAAARGVAAAHLMVPGVVLAAGAAWAQAHGVAELHVPVISVLADPAAVQEVRRRGLRVVAWTVTQPGQAPALAAAGVDAVICDDPGSVLRELAGLG